MRILCRCLDCACGVLQRCIRVTCVILHRVCLSTVSHHITPAFAPLAWWLEEGVSLVRLGYSTHTSRTPRVCTAVHTFDPERGFPKGELPEAQPLEARHCHGLQRLCELLLGGLLWAQGRQDPGSKCVTCAASSCSNPLTRPCRWTQAGCKGCGARWYKWTLLSELGLWGYLVRHGRC